MRRSAGLAAAYAALTIVVVNPIVDLGALDAASYEGDARLLIWTLAWDARALLTATPLFDANIYFPEPGSLAYAEHHLGIGLFALPLYAATSNPVLTYWVLWLLAFPLNALAMHGLAWRVTRDHVAAFAAGCVYAFCFLRLHHGHGHIQMLWTWTLPLIPLALDGWLESPTPRRTGAVAAAILLAVITSWYVAVFAALVTLASAVCLMPDRRIRAPHVVQGVVAAGAGAVVAAALARPYLRLRAGPAAEAAANSADLRAYLLPPANTPLGQLLERHTALEPRWIWGEQTLYVSLAVLVLAAAGAVHLVAAARRADPAVRLTAAVLVAGGFALGLSFGPTSTGAAPFDLLARIPGLALLRAPARFALIVMMAAALLAAYGVVCLRARWKTRGTAAAAVLLALFFAESYVVGFPAGRPRPLPVPVPYQLLASLPRGAVVSLPSYRGTPEAFRESDYLLFSTISWQPIVNGFGRQEPPAHGERMAVLAGFPSAASITLMRELGVRYVVLHARRASELQTRADAARRSAAVRLVHSADGDFLFEIRDR